jgi:hypothetical protein
LLLDKATSPVNFNKSSANRHSPYLVFNSIYEETEVWREKKQLRIQNKNSNSLNVETWENLTRKKEEFKQNSLV